MFRILLLVVNKCVCKYELSHLGYDYGLHSAHVDDHIIMICFGQGEDDGFKMAEEEIFRNLGWIRRALL